MSNHCRVTASEFAGRQVIIFVDALLENGLVYQKAFNNFLLV